MKGFIRYCSLLGLLAGMIPQVLQGQNDKSAQPSQHPPTRWQVDAGATAIRVSELNGWGFGPSVFVNYGFGKDAGGFGLEFGPTAILWSDGFYRFGGLSADLGGTYALVYTRVEGEVSAGPSILAGSDSDGTFLTLGGGYLAGKINYWPGSPEPGTGLHWLGFFVRGSLRLWHTGEFGPAGTAGISIRF